MVSSQILQTIQRHQTCKFNGAIPRGVENSPTLTHMYVLKLYPSRISTPRTRYSKNPIQTVPLHGLRGVKEVIAQAFPELAEFGFTESRVCFIESESLANTRVLTVNRSCAGTWIVSITTSVLYAGEPMIHIADEHSMSLTMSLAMMTRSSFAQEARELSLLPISRTTVNLHM